MLLIMPYFWGLDGIWLAIPITDLAAMVVVLVLLKRELKKLRVTC
jgi:Na+-driven multidrug efflux pump